MMHKGENVADQGVQPPPAQAEPMKLAANSVHLVRTAVLAQMQLSQMADQKANVLMGASSILFTLTLAQLRNGGPMLVPLAILAATALVSAVFAILTVQPRITRARQPVPDEANILFFGVFTAMGEDEFIERMLARLATDEIAYRTMLRDIYQNGQVLEGKKYRLLGHAYRALLAGIVLAGGAALVVLLVP